MQDQELPGREMARVGRRRVTRLASICVLSLVGLATAAFGECYWGLSDVSSITTCAPSWAGGCRTTTYYYYSQTCAPGGWNGTYTCPGQSALGVGVNRIELTPGGTAAYVRGTSFSSVQGTPFELKITGPGISSSQYMSSAMEFAFYIDLTPLPVGSHTYTVMAKVNNSMCPSFATYRSFTIARQRFIAPASGGKSGAIYIRVDGGLQLIRAEVEASEIFDRYSSSISSYFSPLRTIKSFANVSTAQDPRSKIALVNVNHFFSGCGYGGQEQMRPAASGLPATGPYFQPFEVSREVWCSNGYSGGGRAAITNLMFDAPGGPVLGVPLAGHAAQSVDFANARPY